MLGSAELAESLAKPSAGSCDARSRRCSISSSGGTGRSRLLLFATCIMLPSTAISSLSRGTLPISGHKQPSPKQRWCPPAQQCRTPTQRCRRRRHIAAQCIVDIGDDEAELCRIDEGCIYFVTGNSMKEREVNAILADVDIPFRVSHVDIDLPELQGDALQIARQKCLEAAEQVDSAVLVEDTSLCFTALNGMPGPYIKWFVQVRAGVVSQSPRNPRSTFALTRCINVRVHVELAQTMGNEGLYSLLAGHSDHSAYCQCILGFSAGPGAEPLLFVGRTPGTIVPPVTAGGFGWDSIFVPEGHEAPFSSMELGEKNRISHRARALRRFVDYLQQHEDAVIEAIENNGEGAELPAAPSSDEHDGAGGAIEHE